MTSPLFATPIGKRYRWFAWHPVKTGDRGWQWLRFVHRQRFQTKLHLPGAHRPVLPSHRRPRGEAVTVHELEEDFSAQLSRGDSRWWCTCGKWRTPIWHTPHAVREHEVHVREVEGERT